MNLTHCHRKVAIEHCKVSHTHCNELFLTKSIFGAVNKLSNHQHFAKWKNQTTEDGDFEQFFFNLLSSYEAHDIIPGRRHNLGQPTMVYQLLHNYPKGQGMEHG